MDGCSLSPFNHADFVTYRLTDLPTTDLPPYRLTDLLPSCLAALLPYTALLHDFKSARPTYSRAGGIPLQFIALAPGAIKSNSAANAT